MRALERRVMDKLAEQKEQLGALADRLTNIEAACQALYTVNELTTPIREMKALVESWGVERPLADKIDAIEERLAPLGDFHDMLAEVRALVESGQGEVEKPKTVVRQRRATK